MPIQKYNLVCEIANMADVYGYNSRPDSYIWALSSSMANYSINDKVIYNSALKCFMLKPIPGATSMSAGGWDIVTGKWRFITRPDLSGTFARQYEMVDWGLQSKTAIIRTDGCFSIFIRRPTYKNVPVDDSEYQTIGLTDGTTERKFKFYRNGNIEFLTNGTVTETRTVKQTDIQKWREENVVILDFYTLGQVGGVTKMLITSPILTDAIVADKVVSDSVSSKLIINGKNAALVGYSAYTFETSGTSVFNSMSQLTDGLEDTGYTAQLRTFPPVPLGNSITATEAWITGGSGKKVFKPTLTFSGSGYNPCLMQACEFGFQHTWNDPSLTPTWYDITENIQSIHESIPDNIIDRRMEVELVFTDDTKAQTFKDNFILSTSNVFTPSVVFRYSIYDGVTLKIQRAGIMTLGNEIHADNQFSMITCEVLGRLAALGYSDAITAPVSCGANVAAFFPQALAVAGINPDLVTVSDVGYIPDPGWDYDTLQTGAGQSISDYLADICEKRGVVIDEASYLLTSVRFDPAASPAVYTISTVPGSPYDDANRIESIEYDFGNEDYCNSLSIIFDGERYQELYRAWSPDAIAEDGRIIHRIMERQDFSKSGVDEATQELKKILELTDGIQIDVPPTGLVNLYPGTTSITVVTDEIYALGSPDGVNFITGDIEIDITTAGEDVIINGIALGKRNVSLLTIETETSFYPQGGNDVKTARRSNGAWNIKEEEKKKKKKTKSNKRKASPKKKAKVNKYAAFKPKG